MVFQYMPRYESYFDEMRARMSKGVNTLVKADMAARTGAADENWRKNFGVFPEDHVFKGKTSEAIRNAYGILLGDVVRQDYNTSTTPVNESVIFTHDVITEDGKK